MVAALIAALLMLPGGVGAFGAVLCIEADGHTKLEGHGCNCSSTHFPDRTASEEAGAHHGPASLGDEHCKPCVDIPITIGTERHSARLVLVKTTELRSLVFLEAAGPDTDHANSSIAPSPVSYHCKAFLTDVGSIPLRM